MKRVRTALRLLALVASLLLVGPAAWADSWGPYRKRVFSDPTGRYYVVTSKQVGAEAAYVFVEAKAGSAPVKGQLVDTAADTEAAKSGAAGVRPGDRILARGTLKTAPMVVLVSSQGTGFAALKQYGGVGFGNAFVWVTRDGAMQHVKRLGDLFTELEIATFSRSTSSIYWLGDAWLDEDRREVVIVGAWSIGLVKIVSLKDGTARAGGEAEIRRAIAGTNPRVRAAALDLAIRHRLGGLEGAMRVALASKTTALRVRLRAAVVLARSGDRRGADLVNAIAEGHAPTDEQGLSDYAYAVSRLGTVLGVRALPLLRRLMRGRAGEAWNQAKEAFLSLGQESIATLVAMVGEAGESSGYRGGAASVLGGIGSREALPALLRAIADPDEYVANAALNAAIAVGGASIAKDLVPFLDQETTQDGRLAMYFGEVAKESSSIAPLVRCLARHPNQDRYQRTVILEALEFQTGRKLGQTTAVWERWLEAKR